MVAGKGPDYFIYGHIAPDEKELQMVVLVSLPMLRTKTGRRINKDDKDGFFVYPITDPGVVLCCWYSPEVRDDSIINILSGPKKPFEPAKKHAHSTSNYPASMDDFVQKSVYDAIPLPRYYSYQELFSGFILISA